MDSCCDQDDDCYELVCLEAQIYLIGVIGGEEGKKNLQTFKGIHKISISIVTLNSPHVG